MVRADAWNVGPTPPRTAGCDERAVVIMRGRHGDFGRISALCLSWYVMVIRHREPARLTSAFGRGTTSRNGTWLRPGPRLTNAKSQTRAWASHGSRQHRQDGYMTTAPALRRRAGPSRRGASRSHRGVAAWFEHRAPVSGPAVTQGRWHLLRRLWKQRQLSVLASPHGNTRAGGPCQT